MSAFVLVIGALLIWLIFGGSTGNQRGLVIINLRQTQTVVTLDDGQSAHFEPGQAHTLFAIKKDFPQTIHVTDAGGAALFDERVEYSALVDAEFRIAIGEDRIVFGNPAGAARPAGLRFLS
jgi:hypothetical protein